MKSTHICSPLDQLTQNFEIRQATTEFVISQLRAALLAVIPFEEFDSLNDAFDHYRDKPRAIIENHQNRTPLPRLAQPSNRPWWRVRRRKEVVVPLPRLQPECGESRKAGNESSPRLAEKLKLGVSKSK